MRSILLTAAVVAAALVPLQVLAASSETFRLDRKVVNAGGTTSSAAVDLHTSLGEPATGPMRGAQYFMQLGFFSESILPAPTPTVTPSVTPTVIRQFGAALMHEDFVFAAPNPIRGKQGRIFFDLSESAEVELTIHTTTSKLVLSRHWDRLPAGTNIWRWDVANLPNGVYFLVVKAKSAGKETRILKKLAVVK